MRPAPRSPVTAALVPAALCFAQAGVGLGLLRLPFDAARAQYARAVNTGVVPRSILASRDVEHALALLEHLALGPLARRV